MEMGSEYAVFGIEPVPVDLIAVQTLFDITRALGETGVEDVLQIVADAREQAEKGLKGVSVDISDVDNITVSEGVVAMTYGDRQVQLTVSDVTSLLDPYAG